MLATNAIKHTDTQIKQNTSANQANNFESNAAKYKNLLLQLQSEGHFSLLTCPLWKTLILETCNSAGAFSFHSVSNSIRWKTMLLNYCYSLDQWFSKCGPQTSIIKKPWALDRNANSCALQTLCRPTDSETLWESPGISVWTSPPDYQFLILLSHSTRCRSPVTHRQSSPCLEWHWWVGRCPDVYKWHKD